MSRSNESYDCRPGFTIVELLVVIVVIGILATITIVAYGGISQRAISASLESDLKNSSTQLKIYQATDNNSKYPEDDDCSATPAENTICLNHSTGNTLTYTPDNGANPATFVLDATNDDSGLTYRITDDSSPVAVVSTPSQGPLSASTTIDLTPTYPIADTYNISNQSAVYNCILSSKTGQSFTGNGGVLNSVQFEIRKWGAPVGSVYARIYAHSGVYGTSSVATGTELATSDAFDISTLTTTFQLISFNFSGANKINLANGTNYVIAIEYPASGSYGMTFGVDSTTPAHAGNFIYNYGSSWASDITRDMIFYVYMDAAQNLAWTNPNNSQANDSVYATASVTDADAVTHYLKTTNYGFSISAGSTINGIVVDVSRLKSSSGTIVDNSVNIVKSDGTIGTTNKANTVGDWPTSASYASYGSSSDLWGETWTVADINDADFGAAISAAINNSGGSNVASIDHVRIRVYYTEP